MDPGEPGDRLKNVGPLKAYGIEKPEGRVHCSNNASTLKKTILTILIEEKTFLPHDS